MSEASKCQGQNREGGPCSAAPQVGKPWCIWHDPELEGQRQEWNRSAGKAKSNKSRARKHLASESMTLEEMDGFLCQSMHRVAEEKMPPGVASALGTLARAVLAVRDAGEFESRLTNLEEAAGIAERNPA